MEGSEAVSVAVVGWTAPSRLHFLPLTLQQVLTLLTDSLGQLLRAWKS